MLRCTQGGTETLSAAQKSTGSVRNAQGSSQARGESQNAQGRLKNRPAQIRPSDPDFGPCMLVRVDSSM